MNFFKTKSEKEVIQEIHEAFDTAQDRLLEQARAILSEPVSSENKSIENLAQRYIVTNLPRKKRGIIPCSKE